MAVPEECWKYMYAGRMFDSVRDMVIVTLALLAILLGLRIFARLKKTKKNKGD